MMNPTVSGYLFYSLFLVMYPVGSYLNAVAPVVLLVNSQVKRVTS
jgi:hypothetical protein